MKKLLIILTIIISCLGISRVSADTYEFKYSNWANPTCSFYYTDYEYVKKIGYSDRIENLYNLLLDEYNNNYSSLYPYFYIDVVVKDVEDCNTSSSVSDNVEFIALYMNLYSEMPSFSVLESSKSRPILYVQYDREENVTTTPYFNENWGYSYIDLFDSYNGIYTYNPLAFFVSNFDLVNDTESTYSVYGNSNFTINPGDTLKSYYSIENAFDINYTEINLNDYAYVALALKNYIQDPFASFVQVKGQYCITPVYAMGLDTSEEILGTKVQNICSPYYDNYTPVKTFITKDNLRNFAIFYVKAYDITRENYIKVDSNVFDISYISEENKDNPYVLVQGKYYPTIPYDELPSSATKNTDEGYIPGESEEFSFDDIFTAPLDFLLEIWGTITTFFSLITSFIALMPPELRGFLFASFTLGISLGLIKIIIG